MTNRNLTKLKQASGYGMVDIGRADTMKKSFFIFHLLCLIVAVSTNAFGKGSFTTHDLGYVSLPIPTDWVILNKSVQKQINTSSEALLDIDQSNNEILIAANCYTTHKKPSATLRVSVHHEISVQGQEELGMITNEELSELATIFQSQSDIIDKKIGSKTKIINITKAHVDNFLAFKIYKITIYKDRPSKYETLYMIPHNKYGTIKIMLTYAIKEEYFRDIMEYILNNIKIKK